MACSEDMGGKRGGCLVCIGEGGGGHGLQSFAEGYGSRGGAVCIHAREFRYEVRRRVRGVWSVLNVSVCVCVWVWMGR